MTCFTPAPAHTPSIAVRYNPEPYTDSGTPKRVHEARARCRAGCCITALACITARHSSVVSENVVVDHVLINRTLINNSTVCCSDCGPDRRSAATLEGVVTVPCVVACAASARANALQENLMTLTAHLALLCPTRIRDERGGHRT